MYTLIVPTTILHELLKFKYEPEFHIFRLLLHAAFFTFNISFSTGSYWNAGVFLI